MKDHIIIHCSASRGSQDIGFKEIDRWHRERGWWGCGYHAIIRRDGTIESRDTGFRTRSLDQAGAHVGDCGNGWNQRSLGVCLAGGVAEDGKTPEDNFTEAQHAALRDIVTDWQVRFGIPAERVMGHRDLIAKTKAPPKACPSFEVSAWKRQNKII